MFLRSSNPGPGAYNPKPLKKDPSYTMRRQVHDNSEDERKKVPGPGEYHIADLMNNVKSRNAKYASTKSTVIAKASERVNT